MKNLFNSADARPWQSKRPVASLVACVLFAVVLTGPSHALAQDFLTNGLVGHWSFDEGQGTVAQDSSGYGNDGAVHPGATWSDGKIGTALHFNGTTNSYVVVPSSESLNVSTGLTITAWVNLDFYGDEVIVAKWNDYSLEHSYIFKAIPGIELSKSRQDTTLEIPNLLQLFPWGQGPATGTWVQIAATFDSATRQGRLYVGGQVIGEGQSTDGRILSCTADLLIGAVVLANPGGGAIGQTLVGLIDEVRIYSRALSDLEIRTLFDYENNYSPSNTPPVITAQPRGVTLYVGEAADLQVAAYGSWPLTYQWRKDGVNVTGATNSTLILSNVTVAATGDYTVVVSNTLGSVTSAVARIEIRVPDLSFLTNGLVAYYPFNGNAKDYSGYGNDGRLVNAALVPDRFGTPNGAVYASGEGSYVEVEGNPQLALLEASNEITVSFWLWADADSLWSGVCFPVCMYNPPNGWGWELPVGPGGMALNQREGNGDWSNVVTDPIPTVTTSWTHIVMSASRASHNLGFYANGQSIGIVAASDFYLSAAVGPLYLGYSPLGAVEYTSLKIDDLRLYSRALSESEVRALYDYESNLNLTNSPPVMLMPPAGESLYAGDTVRMDCLAAGTWPLAYQWRKDGVNVPNATDATLVLPNVTLADTGDYTVVVSNAFGTVTSGVARVTVTERPWPYVEDFEGPVGQEWSNRKTEVTPVGNRRFLGQFGNNTVTLTLNRLPAHQAVTVSFDLFVIDSWDGNSVEAGPDTWDLNVGGGPTLLHTTFSNSAVDGVAAPCQAFPGDFPGDCNPAQSGAVETNSLGFELYPYGDSVYHLVFTFPHTADTVALNFAGQNLQGIWDESWGLDSVRIELTPLPGVPYIRTELASLGSLALSGTANRVAASGTRALVAAGEGAVVLADLTDPAKPVSLGQWQPLFAPTALALAGNLAYIASDEPGFLSTIEIVDFTDPAKPVLRGYYDTEGQVQALAVVGRTLYVADDAAGLTIVDVGDPARPRRIGGYDLQEQVTQVQVVGQRAYLADGDWLLVLDVSDPTWPLRVGLCDLGAAVQELQVVGQKAYVLVGGELRLLDVADPGHVRLLGTYRTWGVQSLAVAGNYVYLAKGSRGLEVVDVSDPAKPIWATGLATTGPALDVVGTGPNVVVASGEAGLSEYRLDQGLYPPLAPPVIADGMVTLTWPAMPGVRLERTTNLAAGPWVTVAGSDTTNTVRLPMTEASAFFRLNAK